MKKQIILLFVILLSVSCASDKSKVHDEKVITIQGINETHWTYFSLSKGEVVGTSLFGSQEEDEIWKNRKDWDFAICGEYLRTNSGTSGIGEGGIIYMDGVDFEQINDTFQGAFEVDEIK